MKLNKRFHEDPFNTGVIRRYILSKVSNFTISEDDCMKLYEMHLEEAALRIETILKHNS